MSEAAPSPTQRPRPLVLCILDGFGEREEKDQNAIALAAMPNLDAIKRDSERTLIGTSGPDVGLPVGQMGNSEVGHLNFGAGRIALMDISRIDVAIAENKLGSNEIIDRTFRIAQDRKCRVHLFGLVSDGGVHSSLDHFLALIKLAKFHEVPLVLHAFLDGRDTPPKSAWGYVEKIEEALQGIGVIGTISGRYYAMDRDKRWDRVMKAYTAIVRGDAPRADTAFDAIQQSYAAGKTDEFVEPVRIGDYNGIKGDFVADFASKEPRWEWQGEEVGLSVNFRPDRMREISAMLTRRNLPAEVLELLSDRGKPVFAFQENCYSGMTEYDAALKLPVAFPKDEVTESFPEMIARAGLTQLRCAETEKYAHVTYFFNGGREETFPGEDRKLVPSPRDVATYDKKPEMSAAGVASEVVAAIKSGKYDFILVNFANPDMVGHTGILEAAIHANEAVDKGLGAIGDAVREAGGALIITADHGNCEQMKDEHGNPHTAHTLNPVPLYYLNKNDPGIVLRSGGRICDVAPTMLEILGLPQPAAMTGRTLRVRQR
ncbi:2,3-bisphosphoglycerate-independent phosphoglycerate mutase [Sorangium sp. So ce128]|uniref:2,3-bisphosphoglycerate-independent phosphoglycerate mutase n=1 Tax=Sorangium sp. So ce128 TaxID=3133281 RepID=UPI003F5D9252